MTDFIGYYDTGGAEHQGRVVVTAGVIATKDEWDAVDSRWMAVLRRYGLSKFHMKDFAHWKGELAAWPLVKGERDVESRRMLFDELLEASKGIRRAIVRGVMLDDYNRFNARYKVAEAIGGAYAIAQTQCLIDSITWLKEQNEQGGPHRWKAFVERGDAGQKHFHQFCHKYLNAIPDFVGKRAANGEVVTPLALADLVAYEHHGSYSAVQTARNHGIIHLPEVMQRGRIGRVREALPIQGAVITQRWLRWFVEQMAIEPRTA